MGADRCTPDPGKGGQAQSVTVMSLQCPPQGSHSLCVVLHTSAFSLCPKIPPSSVALFLPSVQLVPKATSIT